MSFFSSIIAPTKAIVSELLSDTNFREPVVYYQYTGQSFDSASGHTVNTYSPTDLYGVRMYHNQESVRLSTSDVEIGDMLFMFLHDDFPTEYSLKDYLTDAEGKSLWIKGIDPVFEVAVVVTVSGAK